jgi:MFS family permease
MAGGTARVRRMQMTAMGLLMLGGIVNYLNRSALAVANIPIRQELELNATAMGVLLSACLLAYAVAQIPIGILIDRLGPRVLLGAGIAAWSAVQLACGLVVSFRQFYFARILLAAGEAPRFRPGYASSATGSAWTSAGCPRVSSTLRPLPELHWHRRCAGWLAA